VAEGYAKVSPEDWAGGVAEVNCDACGERLTQADGALSEVGAFIVKVQRLLVGFQDEGFAVRDEWLIYDEANEHRLQTTELPQPVVDLVRAEHKVFLWATLMEDEGDGARLNLLEECGPAPWQEW
jgi:hypothetical protein